MVATAPGTAVLAAVAEGGGVAVLVIAVSSGGVVLNTRAVSYNVRHVERAAQPRPRPPRRTRCRRRRRARGPDHPIVGAAAGREADVALPLRRQQGGDPRRSGRPGVRRDRAAGAE